MRPRVSSVLLLDKYPLRTWALRVLLRERPPYCVISFDGLHASIQSLSERRQCLLFRLLLPKQWRFILRITARA